MIKKKMYLRSVSMLLLAALMMLFAGCNEENLPSENQSNAAQSLSSSVESKLEEESLSSASPAVIPQSLYAPIGEESVLLVDMENPTVRDFFDGGDQDNLAEMEKRFNDSDINFVKPITLDARYIWHEYSLLSGGEAEEFVACMQAILDGAPMLDWIGRPYSGAIAFDHAGFPAAVVHWIPEDNGSTTIGISTDVRETLTQYTDQNEQVEAFRHWFGERIPLLTDETLAVLEEADFDVSKLIVRSGNFGYDGIYFTDGTQELIRVRAPSRFGDAQSGDYVTPQQMAEDALNDFYQRWKDAHGGKSYPERMS
jgi:hypothetical protein